MEILRLSGLNEARSNDKYHGLPTLIGRSNGVAFKEIIERVERKLLD
jgi:hypothetical protein